jgi:hypothetical protein
MEISWSESPEDRPSFEQILKMIRKSGMSSKSVLDSMMEAIEEYTVLLEERLEERAVEFNLTIQGLQKNLSTYMPMSTVTLLTNGHSTGTRQLSNVGIICIDIRNFYKLMSRVLMLIQLFGTDHYLQVFVHVEHQRYYLNHVQSA